MWCLSSFFFFFNDTATTEIYTLSLHDALPISHHGHGGEPGGDGAAARGDGAQSPDRDPVRALARERAARRSRRVDPVRRAGRAPHREPPAGHAPADATGGVPHVRDGAAARPLRGDAAPPWRRLPRDGLLADRHRDPVFLGRAAADLPLLRAARLRAV